MKPSSPSISEISLMARQKEKSQKLTSVGRMVGCCEGAASDERDGAMQSNHNRITIDPGGEGKRAASTIRSALYHASRSRRDVPGMCVCVSECHVPRHGERRSPRRVRMCHPARRTSTS